MRSNRKPIAVSMGEPAGIGPDLALIAWANRKALGLPPFYIRGDEALLQGRAQRMGLNARLKMVAQDEAAAVFPKALPIVQTGPALSDQPGVEAPETAASVVAAIEGCVDDIKSGHACALVTSLTMRCRQRI